MPLRRRTDFNWPGIRVKAFPLRNNRKRVSFDGPFWIQFKIRSASSLFRPQKLMTRLSRPFDKTGRWVQLSRHELLQIYKSIKLGSDGKLDSCTFNDSLMDMSDNLWNPAKKDQSNLRISNLLKLNSSVILRENLKASEWIPRLRRFSSDSQISVALWMPKMSIGINDSFSGSSRNILSRWWISVFHSNSLRTCCVGIPRNSAEHPFSQSHCQMEGPSILNILQL